MAPLYHQVNFWDIRKIASSETRAKPYRKTADDRTLVEDGDRLFFAPGGEERGNRQDAKNAKNGRVKNKVYSVEQSVVTILDDRLE